MRREPPPRGPPAATRAGPTSGGGRGGGAFDEVEAHVLAVLGGETFLKRRHRLDVRVARRGGERRGVVARDGLGVRGGERLDGASQVAHRRVARVRGAARWLLQRRRASPRPAARRRAQPRRARGRRARARGRRRSSGGCRRASTAARSRALLRRQRIVERRRHHLLQPVLLHEALHPPPKLALLLGEHLLVGDCAWRCAAAALPRAWWWYEAELGARADGPQVGTPPPSGARGADSRGDGVRGDIVRGELDAHRWAEPDIDWSIYGVGGGAGRWQFGTHWRLSADDGC